MSGGAASCGAANCGAGSAVCSAVGNGVGSAASGAASGAAGSGAGSALLFSRVLKHDGGARLSTLPGRCEWSPGAVNATRKCRFLGTCLCECHAYQYTQKCLLSAMVCVAQKAFDFCGNVLPPGTLALISYLSTHLARVAQAHNDTSTHATQESRDTSAHGHGHGPMPQTPVAGAKVYWTVSPPEWCPGVAS